jgi:DNA polymerase III subunit epsilon
VSPRPNRGGDYGRRPRSTEGRAATLPSGRPSSPSALASLPLRGGEGEAAPASASVRQALAAMLPPDWRLASYLALDFETTGLDPARERVVEIGALRFIPGHSATQREAGAMACLVNPGMRMPREVIAIHGITDADVSAAPAFREVAPALTALAAGAYIVAHNAPFDLSFLRAELAKAGLPAPVNPVLDTRLLARAAFPGLSSYRLVDLAARFGIDTGRSHRALDDARTCMELLLICARRCERA